MNQVNRLRESELQIFFLYVRCNSDSVHYFGDTDSSEWNESVMRVYKRNLIMIGEMKCGAQKEEERRNTWSVYQLTSRVVCAVSKDKKVWHWWVRESEWDVEYRILVIKESDLIFDWECTLDVTVSGASFHFNQLKGRNYIFHEKWACARGNWERKRL